MDGDSLLGQICSVPGLPGAHHVRIEAMLAQQSLNLRGGTITSASTSNGVHDDLVLGHVSTRGSLLPLHFPRVSVLETAAIIHRIFSHGKEVRSHTVGEEASNECLVAASTHRPDAGSRSSGARSPGPGQPGDSPPLAHLGALLRGARHSPLRQASINSSNGPKGPGGSGGRLTARFVYGTITATQS